MAPEFAFDHFVLKVRERQLLSHGCPVALGARAFDVLCTLVHRAGTLVTKSELFRQVWPGMVVEENNLQVHVSALRKLVGADRIVTIPGQGYRFVGRVAGPPEPGQEAARAPLPDASTGRSIAVLPFGAAPDAAQRHFADGLAEDVIHRLSRSRWISVIARNATQRYGHPLPSNASIARELGVRYLVAGQARFHAGRVRVTADLIDAPRNETVWTESYERPADDAARAQSSISAAIASAVEPVHLRREECLHSAVPPQDGEYWPLLMRARWHFWRSGRDHLRQAEHYARRALQARPDDASSLALLAFVHMARVWAGRSACVRVDASEARRLALRAVGSDDTDAFAHFTLGTALSFSGHFAVAMSEQALALSICPRFAAATGELARLLAFSGRTDEADDHARQACEASPLDPQMSLWIRTRAIARFVEGDYRGAESFALQALAQRPDWLFNHYLLAACQAAAGHGADGRRTLEQARRFGPYPAEALRAGHPFADGALLAHYTDCLRQAGWRG
ncbi:winged helix-turn-helix domain-containing protein [Paracidovorax citrulli]|nr:winged helix-turn-helix domain-containing protein [Paracidovorax citrulli]ATG94369.1 transcriptional regulator [Paracidovorax citrulli]PVY63220.1 TolB-like protein [Paracidovorax citrulli]QCX12487.1 hypothetical protein APS58_3765 [Paracidovorax citrulli]REG67805.1 TolB-like protein [Paracidovorax citrulli]RLJ92364.1 TolB-like protein [Paracidovorax citrulli]